MSWNAYVDNLRGGPGQCTYACVYGLGNNSIYAQNDTARNVTPEELSTISKYLTTEPGEDNDKKEAELFGNGLKFGGTSYTCVRKDGDSLMCNGKGENRDYSLVVSKSVTTLVVGENTTKEVKLEKVREGVEGLRDYLKSTQY